jgi:hypothetical protein
VRGGSFVVASAVALGVVGAPGSARAGRTFYGWLQGTEVMPERAAEIQSWITEENRPDQGGAVESSWVVGPFIGITDRLELGLPVEFDWSRADGVPGKTAFGSYGAELRYRFVTQDPVDAPPFAPLVRISVKRVVTVRDALQPEANLAGSYQSGRVHALADVGFYGLITPDVHHFALKPGAGVSIEAVGDLRFGAEVFADISLDDRDETWVIAGPNLAWSHGRTWLSAAYGIGIKGIKDAPRFQWGIAF